jgi:hypothetical protein
LPFLPGSLAEVAEPPLGTATASSSGAPRPTQTIDHAAAQAHPPTDQLVQAIAATFPPPAITNTAETPAAETVAAHVPLTFPGQH